MWGALGTLVLQRLPEILQFAEALVPGAGKGGEKRLAAATEMAKYEGALALDTRVKDAKQRVIDAQVAYINALDAAAADAQTLGIPIGPIGESLRDGRSGVPHPVASPPSLPSPAAAPVSTSALDAVTRAPVG